MSHYKRLYDEDEDDREVTSPPELPLLVVGDVIYYENCVYTVVKIVQNNYINNCWVGDRVSVGYKLLSNVQSGNEQHVMYIANNDLRNSNDVRWLGKLNETVKYSNEYLKIIGKGKESEE